MIQSNKLFKSAGERVLGDQAVATWTLQRVRRPEEMNVAQQRTLARLTAELRITEDALLFGSNRYRPRPIVAEMLRALLASPLLPARVEELCATVYGRPASMRAIRQTVFRINRAFEYVDCPLAVYCHGGQVFLRPRFRTFERTEVSNAD